MAWKRFAIIAAAAAALAGCSLASQPLAVALAGAGTSTAISQGLSGTASRTFTYSRAQVESAALEAMSGMGIRLDGVEPGQHGTRILRASAIERSVQIELEPISGKATRMSVDTKTGGLFHDAATATEIVLQTEKALGLAQVTNASTGASRARCQ